jgi:NTE family protein
VAPGPRLALVLSGGGARAAYQAGVLQAIAERIPAGAPCPFRIVCGTSAGAINASLVAAGALDFRATVERLRGIWTSLHVRDVYRDEPTRLARRALGWMASVLPGLKNRRPPSLLDNAPLADLLARHIRFEDVGAAIEAGALEALAVTALGYRTGLSVTFCQAHPDVPMWQRSQRVGIPARIGVPHLMASSAIPFVFPPAVVDGEYFGDGAVRQVAPTSPALHLGADRILVVGVARSSVRQDPPQSGIPPTAAQVGSAVLASIFTDALGTDLEKVRLINAAVRQIDPAVLARSPVPLRDVGLLVLTPSAALEDVAMRHVEELPRALRMLLRAVGGHGKGGAGLLSYLLFEPGFCGELWELGLRDARGRAAEIDGFLSAA